MLWLEELRTKIFGPRTIIVGTIILQGPGGGRTFIETTPLRPGQEKGDIVFKPHDGPEFRISSLGLGFFVNGLEVSFKQTGRTYDDLEKLLATGVSDGNQSVQV